MGRPKQTFLTTEQIKAKLSANMEPCPTTGCWLWTGSLNEHGYGKVCFNLRTHYAHRAAYEAWVGPITMEALDHTCNNRPCINPLHLEQCTRSENMKRSPSRTIFCRSGLHLMTPNNISTLKSGPKAGARSCKECMRARTKAHRTPEKAREYNDRYRSLHREKLRQYDRDRYAMRKHAARHA